MNNKLAFDKNITTIPNLKPNEVKKETTKETKKSATKPIGAGGR